MLIRASATRFLNIFGQHQQRVFLGYKTNEQALFCAVFSGRDLFFQKLHHLLLLLLLDLFGLV